MFKLEDELHAEIQEGEFETLDAALMELRHRAQLPWDAPPNVAPCQSWREPQAAGGDDDAAIAAAAILTGLPLTTAIMTSSPASAAPGWRVGRRPARRSIERIAPCTHRKTAIAPWSSSCRW